MYYKLGQACVTNWGSFVLFQIRANVVTNWGKMYYKLGQVLQIRAIITNWGIKIVINKFHAFLSKPYPLNLKISKS